jgi:hypothetical protein
MGASLREHFPLDFGIDFILTRLPQPAPGNPISLSARFVG